MDHERDVRRLIFAYATRLDAGDLDGVAELFAHAVSTTASGLTLTGAADHRRHLGATVVLQPDGTPGTRHVTTNVVVEVDQANRTAAATSYVTVFLRDTEVVPIFAGGYADTFHVVEGEWRFATRRKISGLVGDLSRHVAAPTTAGPRPPTAAVETALRQTLHRYCRGVDRLDRDLFTSCFVPDAPVDYVGIHTGTIATFAHFLERSHAALVGHSHHLGNVLAVTDGARASTEAYATITLWRSAPGGLSETIVRGRYLDEWERVGDRWLIGRRVHVIDLRTVDGRPDPGVLDGPARRDRSDPSYRLSPALAPPSPHPLENA